MVWSFTGAFVFGDSLVDVGNALAAAELYDAIPFNSLPDGAPTAEKGYYKGAFTDGRNVADLISNKVIGKTTNSVFPFGFASYPLQGDPSGNNLNFAYGGAEIRGEDGDLPDIDDQTDAYRDAVDGDADPGALHMLFFGANDVHELVPKSGSWASLATATAVLTNAADEWIEEVRQLIEIGAVHILGGGIPDIGVQPYYNGTANESLRRAAATQYSELLDSLIRARLPELKALGADIHFVSLTGAQAKIVEQLRLLNPVPSNPAIPDPLLPLNKSKIVFFDQVHPTAQVHALAAAYMLDDLAGVPAGDVLREANPDYRLNSSIGAQGEVDKLAFSLVAGSTYTFDLLGISSGKLTTYSWQTLADPTIRIYNPAGTLIASNDDGGIGLDSRVQFTAATSGNYRVEVAGVGSLTGVYLLQAENRTLQNNSYSLASGSTQVVEGPEDGVDRIYASVSYMLAPGSYVETLSTNSDSGTTAISLQGNELGQTLIGNAGSNTLNGLGGNDGLWGKAGSDSFVFTTLAGPGNIDTINDYDALYDTVRLDDAVFRGLPLGTLAAGAYRQGATALDADDRILFDPVSRALRFDPDGNGAAPATQFATLLGTNLNLTSADFIVF